MFELPKRTATIVIPEGDFKGAEVVASRDVPLSLYLGIEDMMGGGNKGIISAVSSFATDVLVSWNLSAMAKRSRPTPKRCCGCHLIS